MSQTNNKKAKKKKAIRRAKKWGSRVMPMAGKVMSLLIVIAILGLMFTALQAIGNYTLRVGISAVISAGLLLMLYTEGLNRGIADVSASRNYMQAKADGRKLTDKEDAMCYHPLKALCAVMAAFAVPLLLAVYLAMNAVEYTYTLQSLPTWMTQTYGVRTDVMAPLAAYSQTGGMAALDWVRLFVRLFVLAFINFFPDPQKMTAMVDRLAPLMMSVMPVAYMIGYLSAPRESVKVDKLNRRAKKIAVRRAERRKVGPELLGSQAQVHYGHKKEEKARKKKELI